MPRGTSDPPDGVLPLDLHVIPLWRYAESLPTGDPHIAGGIKQFEAHLAISLRCLHDGTPPGTGQTTVENDPLFAFSPLP